MSTDNDESKTYFQKGIELFRQVANIIYVWRHGPGDDRLQGVELGRVETKRESLKSDNSTSGFVSPFLETNEDKPTDTKSETEMSVATTSSFIPSLVLPVDEKKSEQSSISSVIISGELTPTQSPSSLSFSSEEEDEFMFLIRFINGYLDEEDQLKEYDLHGSLEKLSQGTIPCLLLDALVPDMVDVRALNIPSSDEDLSFIEKKQNHILCVNSLASIAHMQAKEKLYPEKLVSGDKQSILNLLWRIVDIATLRKVDVHTYPGLRALQEDEEDIFHFLQQTPEDLLLRWINYRLNESAVEKDDDEEDYGARDLSDCSVFLKLQNELNPDLFDLQEVLKETTNDFEKRAEVVLDNCHRLGIKTSHSISDLLSGNSQLNCVLLAQLFESNPGLEMHMDDLSENLQTGVEEFNDEGSREERTFRMWMNSLGCDTCCMNLFSESFRTGWMLLEVLDSMQPGCIDWSRTFKPPFKPIVKRIKSVENCNQVIQVSKDCLHLSLVGIGGDDIADGKKKLTLALVWQLLRFHTLMILRRALESSSSSTPNATATTLHSTDSQTWIAADQDKTKLNENDVLAWANHMLDLSGSNQRIKSFKDPELSNSLALLDLLKIIEPQAVQEKHITKGETAEEKEMNAKYVLSIARKLGATIFIIWEDITEVMPKMILLLIASFMLLEKQRRKMHKAATINNRSVKA